MCKEESVRTLPRVLKGPMGSIFFFFSIGVIFRLIGLTVIIIVIVMDWICTALYLALKALNI